MRCIIGLYFWYLHAVMRIGLPVSGKTTALYLLLVVFLSHDFGATLERVRNMRCCDVSRGHRLLKSTKIWKDKVWPKGIDENKV